MGQKEKIEAIQGREYYWSRSILGNDWAIFFILLGAREAGKSYDVMDLFLRAWKKEKIPFYWLRLSETSTKKMLQNKAKKFIDADLVRKYKLELTVKGSDVYDHGKKMATVLPLSSMAKDKGVAFYDKDFLAKNPNMRYNIALDEFQREKGEKNYFDIIYNLVNQLENLVRSTKDRIRVFFIANALQEASDVLAAFNFIPEEFGIYKLRKKRCVIHYIPPSKAYLQRRKGSVADILLPQSSTFTNKIDVDKSLIYKGRLLRPIAVIKFTKDKSDWFTLWNSRIVAKYNGEKVQAIPMRPYLDEVFNTEARDNILVQFDNRYLFFRDLVTQKIFQKNLELLRPKK